jgi:hypothetical protein
MKYAGAHGNDLTAPGHVRCIVVVDSQKAYTQMPSPLLNRFEKQLLAIHDVLPVQCQDVITRMWQWCRDFAGVASMQHRNSGLLDSPEQSTVCKALSSVFVGFNIETLSSIVYMLQHTAAELAGDALAAAVEAVLLWTATPESVLAYSTFKGPADERSAGVSLVDALCFVQFWSAKCLKWSIVTRAHVPRQVTSTRSRCTSTSRSTRACRS